MKVPRKKEFSSVTLCLGVRYKPEGEKGDNRTKQEDEKVNCLLLGNFLKLRGNRNAFLKQGEKISKQKPQDILIMDSQLADIYWLPLGHYAYCCHSKYSPVPPTQIPPAFVMKSMTSSTLLSFPVNQGMSVIKMLTPLAYFTVLTW